MNKNRILVVVGGAVLLLSIVLVALGFNLSPKAEGSALPFVGMGDVQRFDAAQSNAIKSLVVGSISSGMGDVQRFGAVQSNAAKGYVVRNISSGMGEVQRFDAEQSNAVKGLVVERTYSGMGDLHRYESSQE